MKTHFQLKNIFLSTILTLASSIALAGGGDAGGGEGISARYSQVANNSFKAIKLVCVGSEELNTATSKACKKLVQYERAIKMLLVVPRSRDTILGSDGEPRDGGNDGKMTVFLDTDRWEDKQNENNSAKIYEARIKQVQLAIHEPLVLAKIEKNDEYTVSNNLIDLLKKNNFSFDSIVGSGFARTKVMVFIGRAQRNSYDYYGGANSCRDRAEADAKLQAANSGYDPDYSCHSSLSFESDSCQYTMTCRKSEN